MTVIGGKLAIGAACVLMTILTLQSPWLLRMPMRKFTWSMTVMVLISRLAVFALLYLVLGYDVPSDVKAAYYPEAMRALSGKLVYRDFFTTYSPLFPYVAAIPVRIWDSTKSIVLFTIVLEALAIPLWIRVGRTAFCERTVRTASVFYLFSPLLLSTVAIAGQNSVWISPFLATAFYMLQKNRGGMAGLVFGTGFLTTKFLALIFLPVLFLFRRPQWRFAGSFGLVVVIVCGSFYWLGADSTLPFLFQRSSGQESSGNIPYVLSFLGVPITSMFYLGVAAIIEFLICLFLWRCRPRLTDGVLIGSATVLIFSVVLLLSKKAFTTYWACCFFPLCLVLVEHCGARMSAALAILTWGVTATVEPSIYYRWTNGSTANLTVNLDMFRIVVWTVCQIVLLGTSLIVAALCAREVFDLMQERRSSESIS